MQSVDKLAVSTPFVMMGKPVIIGTGITVEFVLDKLAAGETVEQILDTHPRLSRKGIQGGTKSSWVRMSSFRRCLLLPFSAPS